MKVRDIPVAKFVTVIFFPQCFLYGCTGQEKEKKPNIILINADDLGYAALGCYGQKLIETPNLDRMAANGMLFSNFYSPNTVSVPSRVGLITGMHMGHSPIRDNTLPHTENFGDFMKEYPKELWPLKVPTLGRVMKDAGYKTAQFGKLEAGIPMGPGKMREHGWDYWFGFKGTGEAFQYYPERLWKNDSLLKFPENMPPEVSRPGIVGNKGTYSQDLFITEIMSFLRKNRDSLFFIYFPTQIPHGRSPNDGDEIQIPEIGQYADSNWTHLEKLYAAAITRLDKHVGQILQELKDLGIDKNTAIFFTSDNGDENSYYKYTSRFHATGVLKGKKRYLYEGGIRVPMIAFWPGRIPAGKVNDLPAAGWDFMPTFADLAGVKPPAHADGISLVPAILGQPEKQTKREYLYWEYHAGKQQAVRYGKFKGIRVGGTKEPIELYDLSIDPGELNNIASGNQDIVSKIDSFMKAAREGSPFNKYWPLPEHKLYNFKWDKRIFDQIEKGIVY